MKKILFSISALACVLIFTALAPAQHNSDAVIENLCDPGFPQEFNFNEEWTSSGLNSDQLERVRIELLERGFDPGFGPERDDRIDAQLMEALVEFQTVYELPVTGLTDAATLTALSVPVQEIQYQDF